MSRLPPGPTLATLAAFAGLAGLVAMLAIVTPLRAQAGTPASPPRFRYVEELELAVREARGRLAPALVDPETGLALPAESDPTKTGKGKGKGKAARGVPAFLLAETVPPGAELSQSHLIDRTILQPAQLNQPIRDDLGFATGIDESHPALVLRRKHHLKRHPSLFEVSNLIGVVQHDEVFLAQLEMRWSSEGQLLHVLRTQQRTGPLLGTGFPTFTTMEMVQTATPSGRDRSRMVRITFFHPRTEREPPRIRVHMVGELQRCRGGDLAQRNVHVVSELKGAAAGLTLQLWASAGERYPFLSWESALGIKHESGWRSIGSVTDKSAHVWERPFHPQDPRARGVRPLRAVTALELPRRWPQAGYSGGPLRGTKIPVKDGRWTLAAGDLIEVGGMWQFDRKGDLAVQTPLGALSSAQVDAWFKSKWKLAEDVPEEQQNLREILEVILHWSTDLPQLDGAGPKDRPPGIASLLSGD